MVQQGAMAGLLIAAVFATSPVVRAEPTDPNQYYEQAAVVPVDMATCVNGLSDFLKSKNLFPDQQGGRFYFTVEDFEGGGDNSVRMGVNCQQISATQSRFVVFAGSTAASTARAYGESVLQSASLYFSHQPYPLSAPDKDLQTGKAHTIAAYGVFVSASPADSERGSIVTALGKLGIKTGIDISNNLIRGHADNAAIFISIVGFEGADPKYGLSPTESKIAKSSIIIYAGAQDAVTAHNYIREIANSVPRIAIYPEPATIR